MLLIGAMLAACASMLPTSALARTSLSGAGSSLVAPLVAEWSAVFQSFYDTPVAYYPVASQAGIKDISSRVVDFDSGASGSTYPFTP